MSGSNLFGPIVDGDDVERAVAGTLDRWLNTYLGETERLKGYEPNAIERPLGILTVSEFAKWPEDQIPLVLVLTGGTADVKRRARASYEATWQVGVAPIVSDLDHAASRKLAMAYVAACRAVLTQHPALRCEAFPEGLASDVHWNGEDYTDLAFDDTRSLGTARAIFSVVVNVATIGEAGPRTPIAPAVDPGDWPTVSDGGVKVIVKPEPVAA